TLESVGELDEVFGRGFFEDDDYCRRIEHLGLRVVCAEDVFIHHQLSASFNQLKQQDRQKLFEDNRKIYEAKWGEWVPHGYRKHHQSVFPDQSAPNVFAGQQYVLGQCNVCGTHTRFFYQEEALWRESLNCENCRTTSRYRSITRGILRAIAELSGEDSQSLTALPRSSTKKLHVYDTQPPFYYDPCAYPLPDLLKATGWIEVELSQFKPNKPMGKVLAKGITNQNLECLTFADESLDLVITSDVMEHVRLDDLAHMEIYRVLKPGGIYIFTVPHERAWDQTLIRVKIAESNDPSKDLYLLEPEYHGDTNSDEGSGVLAYRTYGKDLEVILKNVGFEVEYFRDDIAEIGILNTELYYCRKSAS
ncbi:MAG: methyltransferase domain-containing protein, partial [Chlorobium sp.]|nr:methyltransferase domain-containing protein [Chlorobium sp.]